MRTAIAFLMLAAGLACGDGTGPTDSGGGPLTGIWTAPLPRAAAGDSLRLVLEQRGDSVTGIGYETRPTFLHSVAGSQRGTALGLVLRLLPAPSAGAPSADTLRGTVRADRLDVQIVGRLAAGSGTGEASVVFTRRRPAVGDLPGTYVYAARRPNEIGGTFAVDDTIRLYADGRQSRTYTSSTLGYSAGGTYERRGEWVVLWHFPGTPARVNDSLAVVGTTLVRRTRLAGTLGVLEEVYRRAR